MRYSVCIEKSGIDNFKINERFFGNTELSTCLRMWCIKIFFLFAICVKLSIEVESSAHWMVTESGLIQPRHNSPFDMARSYDLLAFLNQEKRWDEIYDIYNDLMKQQMVIDRLWIEAGDYANYGTEFNQDENCVKAGKLNWNAVFLEDGSQKVPQENFRFPMGYLGPHVNVPDCKRMSSLSFSMFAFEHLKSMMQRETLTGPGPEFKLPKMLSPIMTTDQLGHWVTGHLRQNSSSWLHYHMASIYWRIKGSAPNALECSRRAVLYAPREYKDIALGSLGMVLYRSGAKNDSIVVLRAAIDHDPTNFACQYVIGNAYASIGEYNTSLKHYDNVIKLNPDFEVAAKHKYGVLCNAKFSSRIAAVRKTFNELRQVLNEYDQKEEAWRKVHTEFLKTIKNGEDFEYVDKDMDYDRIDEVTGINMKEFMTQSEKNTVMQYFIEVDYSDEKLAQTAINVTNTLFSIQSLIQVVNNHPNIQSILTSKPATVTPSVSEEQPIEKATEIVDPIDDNMIIVETETETETETEFEIETETETETHETHEVKKPESDKQATVDRYKFQFETGLIKYLPNMQVNRNKQDFDIEDDWPTNYFCSKASPHFPDRFYVVNPTFVPFESKGVRISTLLTDMIGMPLSQESELPWHPPTCAIGKGVLEYLAQKKAGRPHVIIDVMEPRYLRKKLLEYLSNGNVDSAAHLQDAEIGHRIYVAMQKKIAPKWILSMLASLYWRVRGNHANALHCLQEAGRGIKQAYAEMVLVSVASIYLEMGYFYDSLAVIEESVKFNLYEPAINFILAELNMMKKNHYAFLFHIKQVIRVEPDFMDGLARNMLNQWYCVGKETESSAKIDLGSQESCAQNKQFMGHVLCERDPKNCPFTDILMFESVNKGASNDKSLEMVKVEEKKKAKQKKKVKEPVKTGNDEIFEEGVDKVVFVSMADIFGVENVDSPKTQEKIFLQSRLIKYRNAAKVVDNVLRGCGPAGCMSFSPDLLPNEIDYNEECKFYSLQLGYWLYVVGFEELLNDYKLKLPSRIKTIKPSRKMMPDCRGPATPDYNFYADRLNKVNSNGWVPVNKVKNILSGIYESIEFTELGAKIVKYLDTHPHSWLGALTAGWWCGAGGHGYCAVKCLSFAHDLAPDQYKHLPLHLLSALLQVQKYLEDAKEVAYLALYVAPKNKIQWMMVALAHTFLAEYDQAIWMYRYSLTLDEKYVPSKVCLHATYCSVYVAEGKIEVRYE